MYKARFSINFKFKFKMPHWMILVSVLRAYLWKSLNQQLMKKFGISDEKWTEMLPWGSCPYCTSEKGSRCVRLNLAWTCQIITVAGKHDWFEMCRPNSPYKCSYQNIRELPPSFQLVVSIKVDWKNCRYTNYAYKEEHSTELLLTKVDNGLLLACDKKILTLVMFHDLSAAFDTVDQEKLRQIIEKDIGIRGVALKWFKSYLCTRTQKVKIGDSYSPEVVLDFGVTQGSSILGYGW